MMNLLKYLSFVVVVNLVSYSGVTVAQDITTFITNTSEPYFFKAMTDEGRANKIMQILSDKADVKYKVSYMPLKRVVSLHAPFVIGDPHIFRDERKRAVFPIDVINSAFFYYQPHNKSLNFGDVSSLSGKTIGVLRGSLEDASFFEKNNIRVEESDSIESLFRKLISNRVDFCIVLQESGDYVINKNFADQAEHFLSEVVPGTHIPIAIMVEKNSKQGKMLVNKYQNVIFDVVNSQQVKNIVNDYYQSDEQRQKYHKYLKFFIKQYQYTWTDEYGD